jgi:hypothetical protein
MNVNNTKSGVIIVNDKQLSSQIKEIEGLPVVDSYKYLGIILDKQMKLTENSNTINNKV